MSRLAPFALVASLTAGSWVGLGSPDTARARALGEQLYARVQGAALPPLRSAPPPTDSPSSVDPSLLPDPTPWPRLNPEVSTRRAWLLAEGPHPASNDGRKFVTFTFDDGPFPETTPTFLHVLARHGVRGTFFWIGKYFDGDSERATKTREVARQVIAEGHFIGNHTHDHERLTILPHADVLEQIDEGALSIERAIGKRPAFFRPPYGQLDAWSSERLKERGAELVLWSVEAGDMKTDDAQAIYDSLRDQLEYAGGGIVLLHDIRYSSAEALEKLLSWIDRHKWDARRPEAPGWVVTDLAHYLRETAASPQPFANRAELEKARSAEWRKHHGHHLAPPAVALERDSDAI